VLNSLQRGRTMPSSQATSTCFGVADCLRPAKAPEVEEVTTPATTVDDTDFELEDSDTGVTQDDEETPLPAEVPRQLCAGLYNDPSEEELQTKTQPPPVVVSRPVQPARPVSAPQHVPESPGKGADPDAAFSFAETFFVFDYDDTILPSTWINRQGLRLDARSSPTTEQMALLGEVAALTAKTLRLARQRGTVIFITNGERGWIELSCQKFMPTLAPLLESVKMVSARTTYEGPSAPSPVDWKVCAFEDELAHHFGGDGLLDPTKRKNVLSLGDGNAEREAVLTTTRELPNCFPKSLKFVERPDISQILKQHELILNNFDSIVDRVGNMDLRIQCP